MILAHCKYRPKYHKKTLQGMIDLAYLIQMAYLIQIDGVKCLQVIVESECAPSMASVAQL